jgi:diguanylate cyclase (GGDEF)-like protein
MLCYDRLKQALNHASRHEKTAAVLFVDLDHFKTVNDTMGHASGDTLLREVARRLVKSVRAEDTCARIGGDEFVVILPELPKAQDASLVAQKILAGLAVPMNLDGQDVYVSASIGVAIYPTDGLDDETLLRNADAAMFRAKQVGRNNFQFYAASMNEHAMAKLQMQNDLRRALDRNEFVLHYQPKFSLGNASMTGLEALLRWQRADGQLVSPAEFVPVLEDTGLIIPVGDWIIDATCAQIRAWKDAGLQALPVAVNLSVKQFLSHDIAEVIEQTLQKHELEADLFEVEITESDAMENQDEVIATLQRLRERGIRVAVDDFGTGYSSLGYLKRLPLDSLKLDRSFVTGLPTDSDDVSIARAVIAMAHSLGLKVVAEGVETQDQREFLAQQGCDQMQGFLLSRPVSAEACASLLLSAPAAPGDQRRSA